MSARPGSDEWRRFVSRSLEVVGSTWSCIVAFSFVVAWTVVGVIVGFSNTWQLVLNTVASVVAFLLVFLIQYSQNRDTRAIHLKLDELIRSQSSRDAFVRLEHAADDDLEEFEAEFDRLRRQAPGAG